jgi:hypothetical protein
MSVMTVQEALRLAEEAEKEGYINKYPKALVVLGRYVTCLEVLNGSLKAELEDYRKRLQTDGSSSGDIPSEQGS